MDVSDVNWKAVAEFLQKCHVLASITACSPQPVGRILLVYLYGFTNLRKMLVCEESTHHYQKFQTRLSSLYE